MATFLRKLLVLALGLAGAVMPLHCAEARISGVADVSYIQYDSTLNGRKDLEATSLQQHYSLLYDTSGPIIDGRLGRYKFAIGGEWAGYNTEIKTFSDEITIDPDLQPHVVRKSHIEKPQPRNAKHLLWDIDVVIDPREMPFKFKAFSRDMKEITFDLDTVSSIRGRDPVIDPRVATNIFDGVHILSGATLTLGVKNGMTNGYNTLFRDLPMILVDYRDEIHRDWTSQTPVDSHLERLAFVSLNKKDNWFHFRTTRFTDRINSDSSYRETQIQLGTVDHVLVRRWIDLTNWIKISVDGQYTKRLDYASNGPEEQVELNLFGIASRRMWEAKTYNYFSRTVDRDGPVYERRIPVYARGSLSPDTEWNLRTSYEDWQRVSGVKDDRVTMQASLRVDTFKRSPFTLSDTLTLEKHKSSGIDFISAENTIETGSTRRFSDVWGLYGSYSVRGFTNDTLKTTVDPNGGNDTISSPTTEWYVSQDLKGRAVYRPSQLWKTELEGGYYRVDGNPQAGFVQSESGSKDLGQSFSHTGSKVANSRYLLTSRTDWEPIPRLKVNVTASGDVLQEKGGPTDYLASVGGTVDYNLSRFSLRIDSRYTTRWGGTLGNGYQLEQSGRIQYNPDRWMDASLSYRYFSNKENSTSEKTEDFSLTQMFNYYLYSTRGVARRILEVNEVGELSRSTVERRRTLSVGLRFNATKQLFVSARTKYSFLNRQGTGYEREAIYGATVGMNFQKLQVALDYSYGRRDNDDRRVDKRLGLNVRKIF